jgi:hypothetical protein
MKTKTNILKTRPWNPFVRYPGLKAMGDADRDGVKNWVDCRPLDKNRQDEEITIVRAGFGKKSTPPEDRDYTLKGTRRPYGNIADFKKMYPGAKIIIEDNISANSQTQDWEEI